MMGLVFEDLDLDVYAVTHAAENENSERAIREYIEEVGGQREGVLRNWVPHENYVSDEVRYTVTQEEWGSSVQ